MSHLNLRDDVADPIGEATLRIMSRAPRYHRWIAQLIEPYLGDRVLEVGAGVANMTRWLVGDRHVVATDPDPAYLRVLRSRLEGQPNVEVRPLRLPDVDESWKAERLDTAVLLNILEHVDEDVESLVALAAVLTPGARVVIFVPAMPALYGTLDRALSHFRRYSVPELRQKLETAGLEVQLMRYCNMPGIFGWWFHSRITKREILPALQVRLYDFLVPVVSRLERAITPPWGQSLLAVARTAETKAPVESRPPGS